MADIQISGTLYVESGGRLIPLDTSVITGPQGPRGLSTWQEVHTFAVQGAVGTATLPGFFVSAATGQTVKLAKARAKIGAGTSVSFRITRNGSDVTGFGTAGSPLRATTTASTTDPADVTLASDDLIAVVVSAVAGSPTDLSVTVVLEMSL